MPTATTLIATKIGTAIVVVVVVIIVTLTTVIVAIPRNMARIPTIETANTVVVVVVVVAAAETTGGGGAAFDRSATGGSNFNSLILVFSQ
jgi:hypothetical protein